MEKEINKGCFECSHRVICFFLENARRNNHLVQENYRVSFLVHVEDIGKECMFNDRKLKE